MFSNRNLPPFLKRVHASSEVLTLNFPGSPSRPDASLLQNEPQMCLIPGYLHGKQVLFGTVTPRLAISLLLIVLYIIEESLKSEAGLQSESVGHQFTQQTPPSNFLSARHVIGARHAVMNTAQALLPRCSGSRERET